MLGYMHIGIYTSDNEDDRRAGRLAGRQAVT